MTALRKVFQIGFNKCATRTISVFFRENGYKAAHWENNELADDIALSKAEGRKPLEKWADVAVFSDMERVAGKRSTLIEAYKEFEFLDKSYPGSYFILNTRNVNDWLMSRIRHGAGNYLVQYANHYGTKDPMEVLQKWRDDWFEHHRAVQEYFEGRPETLLIYDVDADGPEKIVDFVKADYELDLDKWRHMGATTRKGPGAQRKKGRRGAGGGSGKPPRPGAQRAKAAAAKLARVAAT